MVSYLKYFVPNWIRIIVNVHLNMDFLVFRKHNISPALEIT